MQRQEDKVNMRKAVDAGLVVIESSGTKPDKQDTSSSLGNYTTQAVDADIGPVNDEEPFAEVQLTALHNILANEQQHTEQSKPSYDTHLLETIDSNTTPTSTNILSKDDVLKAQIQEKVFANSALNHELRKLKGNIGNICQSFKGIDSEFGYKMTDIHTSGRSGTQYDEHAFNACKSIGLTELKKKHVAREVHATHARIGWSEPDLAAICKKTRWDQTLENYMCLLLGPNLLRHG
ncbi:hypothetical protein Tco_0122642 [Tanacetum coccineum]